MSAVPAAEALAKQVLLFDQFRQFLQAANRARLDIAPLKGAHLLTSVYPENETRSVLGDVDFLVRDSDFDRMGEILEELDFVRRRRPGRPETERQRYALAYAKPIGLGFELLFEPHRKFVQTERHPIDYDAVWSRSVESTFDGVPCRRLAAEDYALHTVIHFITDNFGAPERHVRDVELLIERGGADVEVMAERARSWKCARAAWLVLLALSYRRPDLVPSRVPAELEPPRYWAWLLRRFLMRGRRIRIPARRLPGHEIFFWPLLLDDARQVGRFVRYYGGLRVRDFVAVRRGLS